MIAEESKQTEAQKRAQAKYRASEKFRAARRRYDKSPKRVEWRRAFHKKEAHKIYFRNWEKTNLKRKNRVKDNPELKLRANMSRRILLALKGGTKSAATQVLLGCPASYLKVWIQSQFTPGMTWENHGQFGWHVDHIKPCCSFDLSDPIEQKRCFHYTNLRPLWWNDNLSKGGNLCPV